MGIKVHLHKYLFLRLFVFFTCILFLSNIFAPFAQADHVAGHERAPLIGTPGGGTPVVAPVVTPVVPYEDAIMRAAKNPPPAVVETIGTQPSGSARFIYGISLGIGGKIVAIGGQLFDGAVNHFVRGLGQFYLGPLGGAVNALWEIIRDVFNILFIFSLVYIGLRTILDSEDSGTKKLLGMLIAAALLINFSLYFTKVIVDISNFTAVAIHNTAIGGLEGAYSVTGTLIKVEDRSIAGAFLEIVALGSWFNQDLGSKEETHTVVFSIFMLFFLGLTGFVLAYGALMLFARFIAITIYMIFSPLMFLGWIVPQWKKFGTKWWQGFLSYCFYAPAFIFMLYVTLYALVQIKEGLKDGGAEVTSGSGFADYFLNGTGFNSFILYAVGIGFMFAAFRVSKIMSDAGAGSSMMFADKMSRKLTTGAARYAGGKVGGGAGRGAGRAWSAYRGGQHQETIDNINAREKRTGTSTSLDQWRRTRAEAGMKKNHMGASSFQERKDTGKTAGARAETAHNAYKSQQAIISASTPIERETAVAKAVGSDLVEMTKTKEGRKALIANAGSISDDKMKEIMKSDASPEIKDKLSKARKTQVSDNLVVEHGSGPGSTLEDVIHKADSSELKTIGFDVAHDNAARLTSKQIEDWKDLTPTQKRYLKKKRADDLVAVFNGHSGGSPSAIFNQFKNDTERSKLPKDILTNSNSVQYLNKNILTKIVDDDGIEDTDRRLIRQNIEGAFPAGTTQGDEWRKWFSKNNAGQRYPT
ncbi:MAG: hypothetical protein ACI92I_000275 [Acidimicrobiales bacterium]|jgi:hypothetical protein